MTDEPKLTEAQAATLHEWFHRTRPDYRSLKREVARMIAEARADGWQEGRQWDLLDQYSDTIRQIALSNLRLQRQVREAEQTARAEAWDEGYGAGYDDPRLRNPYRSTP